MNERTAHVRDTWMLSAAVVLGVVLSFELSLIGLPLAAMGIAGLAYRGRMNAALVASAIGIASVGVLQPVGLIFVAPAVLATLLTVAMLSRFDAQWVGALLTGALALAGAARDYVVLRAEGTTFHALLSAELNKAIAQQAPSAGPAGMQTMREAMAIVMALIPSIYFVTGFVVALGVIAGVAWAASRTGRSVKVPTLGRLDLTPHVLWPFIVGMFALAASHASVKFASEVGAVGLNLVFCVGALLCLQGLAVAAGMLDRTRSGLAVRYLALATLVVLDAFTHVVSLVGLVDFWVNFRHLPRDGVTPPPLSAVSGR